MDKNSMFAALDRILDKSKAAVLASVDQEGKPHVRWMTPVTIRGRDGFLYSVTSPGFEKAMQVASHPQVEWMLQSKSLDEIVTVRGTIQVLDNPRTKAEILESIGGNLEVFWRVNQDQSELVVLETIIEEILYFKPLTGEHAKATVA
jgi:general stress protein 26